jgi:hypothetical protein
MNNLYDHKTADKYTYIPEIWTHCGHKKLKTSWKYGQNVTQELYTKIYLAIVESNLEL